MYSRLFNRQIDLRLNDIVVNSLRVKFRIERSTESLKTSTADIAVYNLSEESRRKLSDPAIPVVLSAGYEDSLAVIFKGKTRQVVHSSDGPDWVTQLRCGDGSFELATTRVNQTFKPGTPVITVLETLAKSFNLTIPKDTLTQIKQGKLKEGLTTFINGVTLFGDAKKRFDELVKATQHDWVVQDEAIRLVPRGGTLTDSYTILSNTTGLVGSPEIGDKGRIRAVSLLQPELVPLRKVNLDSLAIKGDYRVEKVVHAGDTHGELWYSELELTRL